MRSKSANSGGSPAAPLPVEPMAAPYGRLAGWDEFVLLVKANKVGVGDEIRVVYDGEALRAKAILKLDSGDTPLIFKGFGRLGDDENIVTEKPDGGLSPRRIIPRSLIDGIRIKERLL
jgi:hypothetical protein